MTQQSQEEVARVKEQLAFQVEQVKRESEMKVSPASTDPASWLPSPWSSSPHPGVALLNTGVLQLYCPSDVMSHPIPAGGAE